MDVQDGWIIFDNDINSLLAGQKGAGVLAGVGVSQRSEGANMSVDVAAGDCWPSETGALIEKASKTNVGIDASHPSLPRKDIVVINYLGTISVVKGTAALAAPEGATGPETTSPAPPDIPALSIILGEVWVGAGVTSIVDAVITDRRVFIGTKIGRQGDQLVQGVYHWAPPAGAAQHWDNLDLTNLTYATKGIPILIDFDQTWLRGCVLKGYVLAKLANDTGGKKTYIRLYNVTDAVAITLSEAWVEGTGPKIGFSSTFTLDSYLHEKELVWQARVDGGTGTIYLGTVMVLLEEAR